MTETVVILGASNKPDRYANKAQHLLQEYGHKVIPVNPLLNSIDGVDVVHQLADIKMPVDTLTLYLGPDRSAALVEAIIHLSPGRVIFNPGTESDELQKQLQQASIPYEEACTLVLLRTGQFEANAARS